MQPEILAAIANATILAGVSDPLRARILGSAHIRRAGIGETIFLQGEAARAVYIVAEGWVKLYRMAPSGTEAVLSVLTRGRSFGEAVALRDLPYPVSAEAITDVTLVRIDAAQLRQQMLDRREVARAYTREHGEDLPEVVQWVFNDDDNVQGSGAPGADTGGDNE